MWEDVGSTLGTSAPVHPVVYLNEILAPYIPVLIGAFVSLLLTILGLLTAWAKQRLNIATNEQNVALEKNLRETLQSALENAAGRAILILGDRLKDVKINVGMPEIREAALQVNNSAADALLKFGLSEERVREMVINKIGVLTASNSVVVPTVEPAASPKPEHATPESNANRG